jgi:hypothetical protein
MNSCVAVARRAAEVKPDLYSPLLAGKNYGVDAHAGLTTGWVSRTEKIFNPAFEQPDVEREATIGTAENRRVSEWSKKWSRRRRHDAYTAILAMMICRLRLRCSFLRPDFSV